MLRREASVHAALAVLGLNPDADREQVTRAYRRLARVTHPDHCQAPDAATRFDALTGACRRALDGMSEQPTQATNATAVSPIPCCDYSRPVAVAGTIDPIRPRSPRNLVDVADLIECRLGSAGFGAGATDELVRGSTPEFVAGPVRVKPPDATGSAGEASSWT